MKNFSKSDAFAFLSILIITIIYVYGGASVPFHPDESTQIFMSNDVDIFFRSPSALFFKPNSADVRQHYRLVDAPLTRTLIGFARMFTAQPPLPSDWNWASSWDANQQKGALPSLDLLLVSRSAVASFIFPALLFFYLAIKRVTVHSVSSFIGVLIIVLSPLVLLHCRRAMAEALLLFGVCLNLWVVCRQRGEPMSLAAGAAIGVLSKQTAVSYWVINYWVLLRRCISRKMVAKQIIGRSTIYAFFVLLILLVFNPVFWPLNINAIGASFDARSETLSLQTEAFKLGAPGYVLNSPSDRLAALVSNLFFLPPSIAELPNYIADTQDQEDLYFSMPFHQYDNIILIGFIGFLLCLFGILIAMIDQFKSPQKYLITTDLIIATLVQIVVLVVAVRFPFQRYVIPLIPLSIFWCVYSIDRMITIANVYKVKSHQ